jgi:putative phosphoribosyl transferase
MTKAGKPGGFQTVSIAPFGLAGRLRFPAAPAEGIVLFAHGSGSSHLSPRNNLVAEALQHAHLASLLFDLLAEDEATDRANVFDIDLLANRLVIATDWSRNHAATRFLPIGYFGASTGAAAALVAAAKRPEGIAAIVSRGGRPDLAAIALSRVRAPTLLIVGADDPEVLVLNRAAQRELRCESEIAVVPGASHLFEEPGTLEAVIDLADHWFLDHLKSVGSD